MKKNDKIEHPRIICGLLSELAAQEIPLWPENNPQDTWQIIELQSHGDFKSSTFQINKPLPSSSGQSTTIKLMAIINGKKVSFPVESNSHQDQIPIPPYVEVIEMRDSKRLDLMRDELKVEIRFHHGLLLGRAYDLGAGHIGIILSSLPDEHQILELKKYCDVILRSKNKSEPIFYSHAMLEYLAPAGKNGIKALFVLDKNHQSESKFKRPFRISVSNTKLQFTGPKLDGRQLQGDIELSSLSLTGMRGVASLKQDFLKLPFGVVVHFESLGISAYKVREVDHESCLKIMVPATGKEMAKWWHFVSSKSDAIFEDSYNDKELLELFTESSFLKGQRRQTYGKDLLLHLPQTDEYSPLLIQRATTTNQQGIQSHVSAARLADHLWLIQEASAVTANVDMASLYNGLLSRLGQGAIFTAQLPRYALFICSPKIKTNWQFLDHLGQKHTNHEYFAVHRQLKKISSSLLIPEQFKKWSARDLTAAQKYKFLSKIDPSLTEIFDLFSPLSPNSKLEGLLQEIAPNYGIETFYWEVDGRPLGISIYPKAPYVLNATGVFNTQFFIAAEGASEEHLLQVEAFLKPLGTSDLQFVSNTEFKNISGNNFRWVVVDLIATSAGEAA